MSIQRPKTPMSNIALIDRFFAPNSAILNSASERVPGAPLAVRLRETERQSVVRRGKVALARF